MNFFALPCCAVFEAEQRLQLPPGKESNIFRGAFGSALCRIDPYIYRRLFEPAWAAGPSGYRDAPRPFVLRSMNACPSIEPGQTFAADLTLFDPDHSVRPAIEEAFASAAAGGLGPSRSKARLIRLHLGEPLHLPVVGEPASGLLRVLFVTLTELKESSEIISEPYFPVLARMLAERVRAIGCLYQGWPRKSGRDDLDDLLDSAERVELTNFHWTRTDAFRLSARNGHRHSIGGFTGWAEYSGPVGAFLPLLEIAHWAGVGRQTVWGKGQIRVESFARA